MQTVPIDSGQPGNGFGLLMIKRRISLNICTVQNTPWLLGRNRQSTRTRAASNVCCTLDNGKSPKTFLDNFRSQAVDPALAAPWGGLQWPLQLPPLAITPTMPPGCPHSSLTASPCILLVNNPSEPLAICGGVDRAVFDSYPDLRLTDL